MGSSGVRLATNFLIEAQSQKGRLMAVTTQLGLRCVSLDDVPVGTGFALQWASEGNEERIVVVTIPGGEARTAYITSGVLADVQQDDRLALLEVCNSRVSENAALPVYLHDADAGWDILVQTVFPVELLVDVPPFFGSVLKSVPLAAETIRERLRTDARAGGRPYEWQDLDRLLLRSLL